ncbi:retrovirus-related pol polyprotein from transposon RE1 [Citrus sinensis]|nr:retrovirus-related pol polyprotein from transposon RE1 [Citrus sinensis]
MEEIKHGMVGVNGIRMHIAEKGEGPVVLFLHGFPELCCLGYSVVAPDLHGYGDTEVPSSSFTSYTCFHVAGDIIALIDFLGVEQVFVVAHDFGAIIAWHLCLFRPERVKSFVSLGMPYLPRDPNLKPVETSRAMYGDNFYICKFQEPGVLEAGIAHIGSKLMIASSLTTRRPGPPTISEDAIAHLARETINLPSWLSEEEFNYYVTKFDQVLTEKNGTSGRYVKITLKFIVGEMDNLYTTPGVKECVQNGDFKNNVPEEIVVIENACHFIHQEKAEEVNAQILDFIKKF